MIYFFINIAKDFGSILSFFASPKIISHFLLQPGSILLDNFCVISDALKIAIIFSSSNSRIKEYMPVLSSVKIVLYYPWRKAG